MKYDALYDNLMESIREKIPSDEKLSSVLAEILLIEKEAVYRRLRKEVPFTFLEVAKISRHFSISIDNVIDTHVGKSRPLQLKLINYQDPAEKDFLMVEEIAYLLDKARSMPDTRMVISANMLPLICYLRYESLCRFYYFRWKYLMGHIAPNETFSNVEIHPRMRAAQADIMDGLMDIKETVFIVDDMIFLYFINNIKYFASINMISPAEVEVLKDEVSRLINDCEEVAIRGAYCNTGNKVQIYIANINFENGYVYAESSQFGHLSLIKAFTLSGAATIDDATYAAVKAWLTNLKRVATLISESGEKERIRFLRKQRDYISMLDEFLVHEH